MYCVQWKTPWVRRMWEGRKHMDVLRDGENNVW